MGDPILAMRIRDGLAALEYLRTRPEIDPRKIVIGGYGMGGIVALHLALIDGTVAGVFSWDGLATFESLATAERYAWSHEDFFPFVLKYYDLPELAAQVAMPGLLANPLGPGKEALDFLSVKSLYAKAMKKTESFKIETGKNSRQAILSFINRLIY
ncbi:dienelactone hydrolase family protein [candidate division KSB1 bacterium]|nr:dienelactone hydrolase family protein [candidate division KSB1 bacterium]